MRSTEVHTCIAIVRAACEPPFVWHLLRAPTVENRLIISSRSHLVTASGVVRYLYPGYLHTISEKATLEARKLSIRYVLQIIWQNIPMYILTPRKSISRARSARRALENFIIIETLRGECLYLQHKRQTLLSHAMELKIWTELRQVYKLEKESLIWANLQLGSPLCKIVFVRY